MPTILTHAAVPLALGIGLGGRLVSRRLLLAGVLAAMLPDLDVLAFRLHVAYSDTLGHRGATHSMAFALLVALMGLIFARQLRSDRSGAFIFLAVSALSHGLLDMFTNGGLGVALWWPLSAERLFAPWRVIEVSPLSVQRLLGGRGLEVMRSELLWVWLPAMAVCGALFFMRRQSGHLPSAPREA
ncbi:inner membrane protein [Oxalobacteraceae bacterium GrIS 1.11]